MSGKFSRQTGKWTGMISGGGRYEREKGTAVRSRKTAADKKLTRLEALSTPHRLGGEKEKWYLLLEGVGIFF